jgi:hypothetical protein
MLLYQCLSGIYVAHGRKDCGQLHAGVLARYLSGNPTQPSKWNLLGKTLLFRNRNPTAHWATKSDSERCAPVFSRSSGATLFPIPHRLPHGPRCPHSVLVSSSWTIPVRAIVYPAYDSRPFQEFRIGTYASGAVFSVDLEPKMRGI